MLLLRIVQNSVTTGEIARFERYLLLSQFFQMSSATDASEIAFMLESVKHVKHVQGYS